MVALYGVKEDVETAKTLKVSAENGDSTDMQLSEWLKTTATPHLRHSLNARSGAVESLLNRV